DDRGAARDLRLSRCAAADRAPAHPPHGLVFRGLGHRRRCASVHRILLRVSLRLAARPCRGRDDDRAAAPGRRRRQFEAAPAAAYALLRWLAREGAQARLGGAGMAGRAAIVAVAIVPVTVALGATLPTLCHALATPRLVGPRGGALYALNTLGGAAGIAAMGF